MKLEQVVIDLAIKNYDAGMNMQEAVDRALEFYGEKSNDNKR